MLTTTHLATGVHTILQPLGCDCPHGPSFVVWDKGLAERCWAGHGSTNATTCICHHLQPHALCPPLSAVCRLVETQPLFLVTECVREVLAEIQRLMPKSNAAALLMSDPDWLLRVQRGQQWLGLHPDSQLGEQVDWKPPTSGQEQAQPAE